MLRVLTFTVVALLLVLCGSVRGESQTKRPHIIFILGNKKIDWYETKYEYTYKFRF